MTESQLQSKIIDALDQRGFYTIRVRASNQAGIPDIIACKDGLFYSFEVKKPGMKATRLQAAIGERIILAGGYWFVIHSIEELDLIIPPATVTKKRRPDKLLFL